ncbi:MAG: pyridoxamine 5'-phosphate oxidase family protein [Candidatus Zixiibacteriota bacterium]
MKNPSSDIAFTPAVKALQERFGSRAAYARMEEKGGFTVEITEDLASFIAERDSFYIATASADGQPYVQHRGGPKGFLRVLDNHTLAFGDFTGNRQYISAGNLQENDKVCLFLMDYVNRRRYKIWGTAKVVEDDQELKETVTCKGYKRKPECVFVITVKVWDVNCPQHITPRYTKADIESLEECDGCEPK